MRVLTEAEFGFVSGGSKVNDALACVGGIMGTAALVAASETGWGAVGALGAAVATAGACYDAYHDFTDHSDGGGGGGD
jgi:hypothetical protein